MKTFNSIRVDAKSALPVYEQIKRAIKLAILTGELPMDNQVPSIRDFAQQLQINPNTVLKVYYQLESEGYLQSRPGLGYFVSVDRNRMRKEKLSILESLTADFVSQAVDLGYSWDEIIRQIQMIHHKKKP